MRAASIVARMTGARVVLQDDNRGAEGKPDLLIEYPDGRTGVIEVVTDIDPGRAAVIQAARVDHRRHAGRLASGPFTVPGLARLWWVGLRHANGLGAIRARARDLLGNADNEMTAHEHAIAPDGAEWEQKLWRLGVTDLIRGPSREPGEVWLLPPPTGGPVYGDEPVFLEWVRAFLDDEKRADVRAKLERGSYDERHCFIACSESTDWTVNGHLGEGTEWIPANPPELPPPITHVWLFNVEVGRRCLHYGPESGWVDF